MYGILNKLYNLNKLLILNRLYNFYVFIILISASYFNFFSEYNFYYMEKFTRTQKREEKNKLITMCNNTK